MTDTTPQAGNVPQAAVDAARESVRTGYGVMATALGGQIRYALEAAAPHIAAAERERIRGLLPYHHPCCDGFAASVADLINEHEDSP